MKNMIVQNISAFTQWDYHMEYDTDNHSDYHIVYHCGLPYPFSCLFKNTYIWRKYEEK